MGRVFVIDPSLRDERSHHYFAALALVAEARELGAEPRVLVHRKAVRRVRRIPATPWFRRGGYDYDPSDLSPASERRSIAGVNAGALGDLEAFREKNDLRPDDFVFFPSVTSRLILAVCQWIAGFDPATAPRFGMCLMFQMNWNPSGRIGTVGEATYRHAFALLPASLRDRIVYTCETEGLASEYEPLVGTRPIVRPIPTLQSLLGPVDRPIGHPLRIAFLGYTKPEKGAHLLPDIVRGVLGRTGDVRFTVQLFGHDDDGVRELARRLGAIRPRPELIEGTIPAERMVRILESTEVLLLPYDAKTYRDRGSALFTEAKWVGVPMVVPAGTAIGAEGEAKGIAVPMGDFSATAAVEAIEVALARLTDLRAAAAREARRLRAEDPGYLRPLLETVRVDAAPEEGRTGGDRPVVHVLHHLARTGGTFVSRCLAAMNGISLLSEVHPRGPAITGTEEFDPLFQAEFWLRLLATDEVARMRAEGTAFGEVIATIARRAALRGDALVLRDWTYVDFTERPIDWEAGEQDPGTYRLETAAALRDHCDVRQAATVRHPAAMWTSWRNYRPQSTWPLAEFVHGCRRFAERAVGLGFVRYEDITRDPAGGMRRLCALLEVDYDPGFLERWHLYRNLSGDVGNLDSSEIRPTPDRAIDPGLLAELDTLPDYRATVELLGYNVDRVP